MSDPPDRQPEESLERAFGVAWRRRSLQGRRTVLGVERDEHGERWRSWRSVSSSIVTDEFSEIPVEGPRKVQGVVQSFAREGHDSVTWLARALAVKTDRSVCEVRVIAEVLRLAGCNDQLNLGGLACMQAVVRWQLFWEAHTLGIPKLFFYQASDHFGIGGRYTMGVAVALAQHVARSTREGADIEKQRSGSLSTEGLA